MHFTEMDKFSLWFDTLTNKENIILIFDHELNQGSTTGLDLLEKIKPNKRGYLITSHAEEVIIQKRCSAAGIWLLPKALFECIEFVDTHQSWAFK